jgi:hypothetical protein
LGDVAELDRQLARILADGLADDIDDVDWSDTAVQDVMSVAFADPSASPRANDGSAVYQYLWALQTAQCPYVLHFDDDMLVHCEDGGAWIREGIQIMRREPRVAIVTPEGGPLMAQRPREWILGRRHAERATPEARWHTSSDVSTRYFLTDRDRLVNEVFPLLTAAHDVPLEVALTRTMRERGFERRSRNDPRTWAVHPRRHNRNHLRYLADLIGIVEQGRYPYRRTGHRWDLRTEGRHFIPWWLTIANMRLSLRLSGRRWESA